MPEKYNKLIDMKMMLEIKECISLTLLKIKFD